MTQLTVTLDSPGITDVSGFETAGVACDIRGKHDLKRLDLALFYSLRPCTAAGPFTKNAGKANACTGPEGLRDAQLTAQRAAALLNLKASSFFVCSTGRIGQPMPMDRLVKGLERAVSEKGRTPAHGKMAADAILTSDTRPK